MCKRFSTTEVPTLAACDALSARLVFRKPGCAVAAAAPVIAGLEAVFRRGAPALVVVACGILTHRPILCTWRADSTWKNQSSRFDRQNGGSRQL